jgi:hypothetical protein
MLALSLLFLIDIGLYFFIFYLLPNILTWFEKLDIPLRLFILAVAGGFLLMILFLWTKSSSSLIGGLIFKNSPQNPFTIISTFLLSIANAVLGIFWLWRTPERYNLSTIYLLLVFSLFIWVLCMIAMPSREQLKKYE